MDAERNYLLGDAADFDAGDSSLSNGGEWAPLELVVAPRYRGDFMFMGTVSARVSDQAMPVGNRVDVHRYKHVFSRQYVNVDKMGQLYEWAGDNHYRPISLQDARRGLQV